MAQLTKAEAAGEEPAFGLSIRDIFAALAMVGLCASGQIGPENIPRLAKKLAQDMIKELSE